MAGIGRTGGEPSLPITMPVIVTGAVGMVGGTLGRGRHAPGVQPFSRPGYGEPGTRVECVAAAPDTPRWPGRPAHADGAPHVSHDATHDAPDDMNAVVSLKELERSWQRTTR
jgi:hypothetical protein